MTVRGPEPTALQVRPAAPRSRYLLALIGWTVCLMAAVVSLHAVGGALAPPSLTQPGRLGDWLDGRQPAEAAFAVLRLVALGLAWYLLVVTVAGVAARASRLRSLVRVLDAVTVPAVRRMVAAGVGVSFAAAVLTGPGGTALAEERRGASSTQTAAETIRRLPDTPMPVSDPTASVSAPPSTAASGEGPAGAPPVMRRLSSAGTDPATDPAPGTPSGAAAAPAAPADGVTPTRSTPGGPPAAAGRSWTVAPGDHFWAVAEGVLADAWGRAPTDAEVDPYWRAMVQANVDVLRDPGNPDLLFQGQVIDVPVPPPRPSG